MAVPVSDRSAAGPQQPRASRLLSLDVLRGLDVLLMLFVNEMAGVHGTPAFLLHVAPGVDGMTITDVVFPAFLFIAGMAIPLAIGARLRRSEPRASIWRHVCARSLSLVVMGVFMVNAEEGSALPPIAGHLWNVLVTCAVLMAWQAPGAGARRRHRAIVGTGILLLAVAAFSYRSADAGGLVQLRPHWWGILGLIGWAYLAAATAYLVAGDRVLPLLAASAALYGLYFVEYFTEASWLVALRSYIDVASVLGSHGALVTSGAALTVLVRRDTAAPALRRARDAAALSVVFLAAGLAVHAFKDHGVAFWINKPLATPAWCLVSAGITGLAWTLLYAIVDVGGWTTWPPAVTLAGENALLAYLLAPLAYSLLALSVPLFGGVDVYQALGPNLAAGCLRSIVFAWAVVRLCGWLRGRGLRPTL